jgi:glycosyltransferase involved in cell wall biosynthesis
MMSGAPVVASNLPGVRQPVMLTGMGEVVPVGDSEALGEAIIRILSDKEKYIRPAEIISESFDPDATAAEYIKLFQNLENGKPGKKTIEPAAHENLRLMKNRYS